MFDSHYIEAQLHIVTEQERGDTLTVQLCNKCIQTCTCIIKLHSVSHGPALNIIGLVNTVAYLHDYRDIS